ncbi:hypothetical protein MC7420_433 [Coleofasciculus chthonoplastes PCC 7420]|uniref:Uncharacterized protein n=1 Tax=Coleofasciculus chthonoplastes PCC 7420 TaxID=118168 RepID=B4VLA3_9CYAN|nr:hypothetical protein [Coleofasciculus chthonoplastes]EDX77296.1 hypothetical protein MC7420_433 [Coleofasciculus chthonoplastes PCC 7420]
MCSSDFNRRGKNGVKNADFGLQVCDRANLFAPIYTVLLINILQAL